MKQKRSKRRQSQTTDAQFVSLNGAKINAIILTISPTYMTDDYGKMVYFPIFGNSTENWLIENEQC